MRDGNQRRSAEHERVRGTTVRDLGEGSAAVRRIRTALGERGARLQGPVRARALPPRQAQGRARAPRGGGALCSAARAPRGGGALCGRAPGRRAEAGRSAGARPGAGWRACSSARGARAAGRRAGWRAGSSERGARAGGCRRGRGRSVLRGCFGRAAASSYYPSGASGPVAPRGGGFLLLPERSIRPRGTPGVRRCSPRGTFSSGRTGGPNQGICGQNCPFWPSGGFLLLPERSIRPRGTPGVRRCSPRGTFSSGRTGGPKARHLRANLAVLAERRLPPTTRAEHPAPWHPGGTKVLTEGYVFERPHGRAESKAFACKFGRFGRAAASSYYPSGASGPVAPRGYEGAHRGVRFRAAARACRKQGICGKNCPFWPSGGFLLLPERSLCPRGTPGVRRCSPRGTFSSGRTGGPKRRHLRAKLPPRGCFGRAAGGERRRQPGPAWLAGRDGRAKTKAFAGRFAAGGAVLAERLAASVGGSPGPRGLRGGTGGPKPRHLLADFSPAGLFSPSGGRRQPRPSRLAGRDGRAKTGRLAGRFAAGGAVFAERRAAAGRAVVACGTGRAGQNQATCGQICRRWGCFRRAAAAARALVGEPRPRHLRAVPPPRGCFHRATSDERRRQPGPESRDRERGTCEQICRERGCFGRAASGGGRLATGIVWLRSFVAANAVGRAVAVLPRDYGGTRRPSPFKYFLASAANGPGQNGK
uniref:Uncharacterized protein n=1 Tax=Ananas comosus var. bracteatus TaxID=296719 RepID=A0A6V7PGP6_ANACO|nr:unnamed protein product [Ananas comosus var. bracteatus]